MEGFLTLASLVTFDFHNTIAYCDPWFYLEIRDLPVQVLTVLAPDVFERHGAEVIIASYRELRQDVMSTGVEVDAVEGIHRIARGIDLVLARPDIERTVATLMKEVMSHATPVPGALESIRSIAASGIKVGVISSAVYHPFLEWTLAEFGVADELDFVITSASSGIYKSDPEIYRTAIRTAGADAVDSIHVGDSERWDVWSAKQAGMRAIWYRNGKVDSLVDRPMDTAPDHIVSSMSEVGPWVLENMEREP
jgi:FMN phosphatase YigB (HAD superfamily)